MIITEPTSLENMELIDGVYRSTKNWYAPKKSGSYAAVLHYDLKKLGITLKYGSTVSFTDFRRSGGFPVKGNWKPFRMWSMIGQKPNTYIGTPKAELMATKEPMRIFTEDLFHDEHALKNFGVFPFGDDLWHREEIYTFFPTSYATPNGVFSVKVDDKPLLKHGDWKCEGAGYKDPKTMKVPKFKGLPSLFCIQLCYQDNGTGPLPSTAYCHVANPVLEIR